MEIKKSNEEDNINKQSVDIMKKYCRTVQESQ
jgi:hypothetical protein